MRRRIVILMFVATISWARPDSLARAEVIDRTAAVVDGRIITASDIRKEHSIEAALGDPVETDDALLKSMIDTYLLEEEMAQFPGLDVSDDEVDERMKAVSDMHGIAPSEIRNAISRKIQRLRYLNLRYVQFIVVSNEEIGNYYNSQLVPELKAKGVAIPALTDTEVVNEIRDNIIAEKLSSELETSLESLRARSNYEILQ